VEKQHIRILNLEDSAIDADLITRELKRANLNFSISRVETEASFRDALERSDPDVILADYNLPGFDGIAALKIARSFAPDVPFIFVSGSIGEDRAIQALREGATDYVIKDRMSRLPSAITRALAEKRERQLRQRTQEALRISEERFQYAARATLEVIWDWSLETDKVSYNEALRTAWGYDLPDGEADFAWWAERIHPEDRDAILRSIGAAMEKDDRWSGEYRFQRADGTYRYVFDRAFIVRDPRGKARRMIGALLDVTEERRADERVRESELRFRSVAETATDAIVLSDLFGKIVFWNEGATRLFGYSSAEMVGQSTAVLMPERYRSRHEAGMKRYRDTGVARVTGRLLEFEGLRKDGTEFPMEMSLTIWKSGGEAFCTALMRDISARVAYERRQHLQFAVARTLAEATSVADVTSHLLRNVGGELHWQAGLWWSNDRERGELRCTDTWSAPDFAGAEEFLASSRRLTLRFGEGLPGLVALSGHAVAIHFNRPYDAAQYPRAEIARKVGLTHGAAFAIVEHDVVTAVIEFFEKRPSFDDELFLDMMTDIGRRIGEFFERRRAEESLIESETNLAEAQQMAKLGSFHVDVTQNKAEWSPQASRIFGVAPEDFGETFEHYLGRVHPDDIAFVRRLVTPPLIDSLFDFRHRIIRPDGEIRFVHNRIRVVAGSLETPEKIVGIVQDVTEQVQSEEKIQQLSHRNEMILNHAAEGILGIDMAGRVIFANPAAARFTGWSAEELQSAPTLHSVIHHSQPNGDSYPQQDCPIYQSLADGKPRSGEESFWRKSGEPFPAQFTSSPIVENEHVIGCVVTFEDITERKRLEHQLEQANRVSGLGRVAATIAHEFNNVLMGIQPFAEAIRKRSEDEKTLKAAAQITTSVARGKRVTQEILRFTQPAEPALQPVSVKEWLQHLLPELQSLVGPRIEIDLKMPSQPIIVRGDPVQLQQVLTNLVLNARDAMAGGGVITIAVHDETSGADFSSGPIPPGVVLITVHDTGGGMSPEVLRNIFEPLFTTKRTGTGLGLAVALQVIRRHGGSIHAESKVGQGTTFFIFLPTAPAEMPEVVPEKEVVNSRIRRVLLVEDEPAVATGIVLLLEAEGIEVRAIERGGEALDAIKDFRPDGVILDMSLPDMRGTEVYERIAAQHPDMPVLFSSGHGDESQVENFTNEHVAFLRKPYEFAALMTALDNIAGKRRTAHKTGA
jgi:PAS domain S-box-containing protein